MSKELLDVEDAELTLAEVKLRWEMSLTHKLTDQLLAIDTEYCPWRKGNMIKQHEQYVIKARRATVYIFGVGYIKHFNNWYKNAKALVPVQKCMMERCDLPIDSRVLFGKAAEGMGRGIKDSVLVSQYAYYVRRAREALRQLVSAQ